eukprot:SAG22_NODE_5431_length_1014_cov_1.478689_2_plen_106_part_01
MEAGQQQRKLDRLLSEQAAAAAELAASQAEVAELRSRQESGFGGDPAASALHQQLQEQLPQLAALRAALEAAETQLRLRWVPRETRRQLRTSPTSSSSWLPLLIYL